MLPSPGQTPIGVGLIGYGYAGSIFHAPLIQAVPGLCLATVASSAPDKVKSDWPGLRVAGSAEALLADPDVGLVVIAAPNHLHFDLASKALESGKHVVVDKPFTLTLSEAETLACSAKQKGLLLSVFHNRRWDADFLTLRDCLAQGRLGSLSYFESRFDRFRPQVRDRWREKAIPGGGLWYDLGPHLVDQALLLFGMPWEVHADLERQRYRAQAVDFFRVRLNYPGIQVVLQASMLGSNDGQRFLAAGSDGCYVKHGLDTQEAALKRGERPGGDGWGVDPRCGVFLPAGQEDGDGETIPNQVGNYLHYYEGIRDALIDGAPNPVPAEDAVQCMRIITLTEESQRTGRPIAV